MTNDIFQEGGPFKIRKDGDLHHFTIPIPPDNDGMGGRCCPDTDCSPGYFKVRGGTGLSDQPTSYCPYCRKPDVPQNFFTQEQKDYAINTVKNEALKGIDGALRNAMGLGPSGKRVLDGGLISIEFSMDRLKLEPVSRPVEEELRRNIECPTCRLQHAVFGLAVWCPDCGSDIFLRHVDEELLVIRKILPAVESRRATLGARVAARDIENALEDTVSIFEAVLKFITRRKLIEIGTQKEEVDRIMHQEIRSNYQNIPRGAEIFKKLVHVDFLSEAATEDIRTLDLAFQRRHSITHNLGVIDRKYLDRVRSGEIEGREVRITENEVHRAVEIVSLIIKTAYQKLFGV